MKSGVVLLMGRPNAGKSTLLNNILNHKVSITSPKPQTTRFALQAVFEDDRGQILFIDTPGIFAKIHDPLARKINQKAEESLSGDIDLVIYLVDHTREKSYEENKTLGLVRKINAPKILVINKVDIKKPTFIVQYKFMEEEFDETMEISALKSQNLHKLLDMIFAYLPERPAMVNTSKLAQPGLNLDSKLFLSEIIREKAFLFLRKELPYTTCVKVEEIEEKEDGLLYIRAKLITTDDKYKRMIIGKKGAMIKEISMAARKELETAANKKIFLDLTVEVDPHWIEYME